MSAEQIAELTNLSKGTVLARFREIEKERDLGTYPAWVLMQDGKIKRCLVMAFIHYENNRTMLKYSRNLVPVFA